MKTYKQFTSELQEGGVISNMTKGLSDWWNKGRNVRVPNENQATWRQLAADDARQIGKVKVGQKLTNIPNPIWSFTKGLSTGPTPAVRQAFERPVRSIAPAIQIIRRLKGK